MPNRLDKYFWDSPMDSFSPQYQLVRLLEYATFPDLFIYPFQNIKEHLASIDLERHRIPESRKKLFKRLVPYAASSSSLDEAIRKYVDSVFKAHQ